MDYWAAWHWYIRSIGTEDSNKNHDGTSSIRVHLLNLVNMSNKLNALDIDITDQFLVHMFLYFLSSDYVHVKAKYNTQNETWNVCELIAICRQKEEWMKKTEIETTKVPTTRALSLTPNNRQIWKRSYCWGTKIENASLLWVNGQPAMTFVNQLVWLIRALFQQGKRNLFFTNGMLGHFKLWTSC